MESRLPSPPIHRFHVTFHFKSTSTAKTNHPTYIGWYDYVVIATGRRPTSGAPTRGWQVLGADRAARCRYLPVVRMLGIKL